MTTRRSVPSPTDSTILQRIRRTVLAVAHGIDAGSLVAHGRPVPQDHPARHRLDHEEVERRLAELYPRQ